MNKISKFIKIAACGSLLFMAVACDDFLDKGPLTEFTDGNYWASEANVRTFAALFYNEFLGYGNGSGTTSEFYFQGAGASSAINISDDLCNASFLNFQGTSSSSNTNWNDYYKVIRHANLMILRVPTVPGITDEAMKHWEGVARLFRAFTYFRLVQRFGDVPYVDTYAGPNETDKIYVTRTNRNEVMDKVYQDLDFAVTNIRLADGTNAINRNVAYALQSRICLYEGTYRKYHNLGDGTEFLNTAKAAALAIMSNTVYQLNADFQSVYNSVELSGSKEMILYKDYQLSVLTHSIQAYTNTSSIINGLNRWAVESYACTDGLPISQSPLYQGDTSIDNVRANRDKRLLETIAPKLAYSGKEDGGLTASTGYRLVLYTNPSITGTQLTTIAQNHTDAPVLWLAEVYLNYAEACAELGTITQADLDLSVNKLRTRAGIAPLEYVSANEVKASGVTINDPVRTSSLEQISGTVSPIIWEIRRERRAELMSWTYGRLYDLMRWKKGQYLDMNLNPKVGQGAKVGAANAGKMTVDAEGYILPYGTANKRAFTDPKNYLNSIPTSEITLYQAEGVTLTQNPGWN